MTNLETTAATAPTVEEQRTEWIASARTMLDWLEQHPTYINLYSTLRVDTFVYSKEELAEAARIMRHADKSVIGDYFTVRKTFGEHTVDVNAPRTEVCRKVVTGTREIPEQVVPARTEDIVEWVCDEPLLKPTVSEAVA